MAFDWVADFLLAGLILSAIGVYVDVIAAIVTLVLYVSRLTETFKSRGGAHFAHLSLAPMIDSGLGFLVAGAPPTTA